MFSGWSWRTAAPRSQNQQSFARFRIVDVLLLVCGEVQPFRKDFAVAGCLIQQRDEVAVFQNVLDLRGRKKVLHILGGACGYAAPFAEAFPNLGTVRGGLFFFQQKVELVCKIPCSPALAAVLGDAAPYLVLDNEHPQFFNCLPNSLMSKATSRLWMSTFVL